jgi:aspartate ammonia-lyase
MDTSELRTEQDLLGALSLPKDALYGIETARALENFPLSGRGVHPALIHAYGAVKLACAQTNHELGYLDEAVADAVESACREMMQGGLDEHLVVDALQGGAGTSTNMNVNEVLANRALQILEQPPGNYQRVHPLETLNLHQSTNDTYPTALRIASIGLLRTLEPAVVALLEAFQSKEKEFAGIVKIGRTQMQDAVLTTLGREMSAYAEAFSRDRWRIYKCEERLRVVNLGGTAIGTGLSAPRQFIFRAVEHLREITGYGLARAENLVEATQNADVFVEVSGILKACASNLIKVCTDLRLLSSGPYGGLGEVRLPARQAGSSIMPGKVNPVIPEAATQAAMRVMANDQLIAQAASMGSLELNPFLPVIADALLESLSLLAGACDMLRRLCVEGLQAQQERCRGLVETATATVTALVETIGYDAAQEVAICAQKEGKSIRDIVIERGLMSGEEFEQKTSAEAVTRLGTPKKSV